VRLNEEAVIFGLGSWGKVVHTIDFTFFRFFVNSARLTSFRDGSLGSGARATGFTVVFCSSWLLALVVVD